MSEEGKIDRGVRQGVLSPRHRRAAAALAAAVLGALVFSCGRPAPAAQPAPEDPRAVWYQLQSGKLAPIKGMNEAVKTARQPWTVQERISDQAFSGDTVYLAVNGHGLAAFNPSAAAKEAFRAFYDDQIFSHRTITALVPRAGEVLVHLYFNGTLNTVASSSLPLKGFTLASLVPSAADYRLIITPFQEKDPGWEAVGFMPLGPEAFLMEWKRSGEAETSFAYTQYQPATGAESVITRDAYQASYIPAASPGVSAALSSLFKACRQRLTGASSDAAVHFSVRSRLSPVRRIFRSGEGVESIIVIPVFQDGADSYALLPDGRILRQAGDGSLTETVLPALPADCRYTDLVKAADHFMVPWEEARFTQVGAAGLLLYKTE